MKVKVIKVFQDKYDKRLYAVGQVLDWDDQERIVDCQTRGLVEIVPEEPKKTKPKTTKKAEQQ